MVRYNTCTQYLVAVYTIPVHCTYYSMNKPGDRKYKLVLLWVLMEYSGKNALFKLIRLQFPLNIEFTLTINRAQGQFISKIWYIVTIKCVDTWSNILHSQGVTIRIIYLFGMNNNSLKFRFTS